MRKHKKEFRSRNSPPAAGRFSGMIPFRRSAFLAERFLCESIKKRILRSADIHT